MSYVHFFCIDIVRNTIQKEFFIMKNKKLVITLSAGLIALIAAFAVVFALSRPETEQGSKEITVTVVFADESEKEYVINTDAEYLGDALLEEKLVSEEEHSSGFYTVIAGERADYTLDGRWWGLYIDGEMGNLGINQQPIADGETFEIANTPS